MRKRRRPGNCVVSTVTDKASLFRFVQKNRLGVATNDLKIQYPLLTSEVKSLVRVGSLIHLRTQSMLCAVAKIHGQEKCDDDWVAMWNKCKSEEEEEEEEMLFIGIQMEDQV